MPTEGAVVSSVNGNLQGQPLARVARPDLTVMVYEGSRGVLDFRHRGQAVVGFVDGNAKAVTAEEVRTLRWKP